MYKIGIDIGYGNTKIITEGKVYFPSLAKPGEKLIWIRCCLLQEICSHNKRQDRYIGHMAKKADLQFVRLMMLKVY